MTSVNKTSYRMLRRVRRLIATKLRLFDTSHHLSIHIHYPGWWKSCLAFIRGNDRFAYNRHGGIARLKYMVSGLPVKHLVNHMPVKHPTGVMRVSDFMSQFYSLVRLNLYLYRPSPYNDVWNNAYSARTWYKMAISHIHIYAMECMIYFINCS